MRFGSKVIVQRGSARLPAGTPGSLREVRGVLVGAQGVRRHVRLSHDDPLATVGYCTRQGDAGWWPRSAVRLDKR